MGLRFKKLLSIYLCLLFSFNANSDSECQELLNWIYKDVTVKNLDHSYDRLVNKMLLGLIHVHRTTANNFFENDEYKKIKNTLITLDNSLSSFFNEYELALANNMIPSDFSAKLDETNLETAVNAWKKLQDNSPDLFIGLEKQYQLDEWDILTSNVLSRSTKFGEEKNKYKQVIDQLGASFNTSRINLLAGRSLATNDLKENIDNKKLLIIDHFRKNYIEGMNAFSTLCTEEEIEKLVLEENYVCLKNEEPKKNDFLEKMGLILTAQDKSGNPYFSFTKKPRLQNLSKNPNINIHKPKYKTNAKDENSTYCIRDPRLVDTIVLHHAASRSSPEAINNGHLERGAPSDPWLMVGYNYMIEDEEPNWRPGHTENEDESGRAYSGRSLRVQGAHAGGRTEPLTEVEKEFYKNKVVYCGNSHQGFKQKSVLDTVDENGGLSGNLTSFGISVLGDYSFDDKYKLEEVAGVMVPRVSYLPDSTVVDFFKRTKEDVEKTMTQFAKLSCDIQKKFPNVKRIVPHQYFKDGKKGRAWTMCPGYLINYLGFIAKEAKKLGCHFEVEASRRTE